MPKRPSIGTSLAPPVFLALLALAAAAIVAPRATAAEKADAVPGAAAMEKAGAAKGAHAEAAAPRFHMLVIAELLDPNNPDGDEIHRPYVEAAKIWLGKLAADSGFTVSYLESPNTITDDMLSKVDIIWQMNYTPFRWSASAKAAFEKYMEEGRGGWLGDHHATLYGSAVTNEKWPYFFDLIGGINYKNYISKFASGNVRVEDSAHPVLKGVPATFKVTTEEWYIWDKSPRPKVHVLANVDENSYKFADPAESGIKMGDHPVVWTNESFKARNLYVFMGHHPNLFDNAAYTTLLRNAIMWVADKPAPVSLARKNGRARADGTVGGAPGAVGGAIGARAIRSGGVLGFSAPGGALSGETLDANGRALRIREGGNPGGSAR